MRCSRFIALSSVLVALGGATGCVEEADSQLDVEGLRRDFATAQDVVPLPKAAAMARLTDICPPARADELCVALRAEDYARARAAVAAALSGAEPGQATVDPAIRYYLRERSVSLVVWNILTDRGRAAPPADYASAAAAVLDEHYPAYKDDPGHFAMARRPLPPNDGAICASQDTLVIFPGVLRLQDRSEFVEQTRAIREALPCLRTVVVDTEDFMDPAVNAAVAKRTIEQLAGARAGLHFVGYSQGSTNALRTLVDNPDIAARVRSVLTLNSAAHGSEVVDVLLQALASMERKEDVCTQLPAYAGPTCAWAKAQSPRPAELLVSRIASDLGITSAEMAAVDPNATLEIVREFLRGHIAGVRSLGTAEAEAFWKNRGAALPRGIVYTSFRSAISDTEKNLPPSNAVFYHLLTHAGGDAPYNDMQVLLAKQSLGGPLADREVMLPVAEGNHWQWEYTEGQMDALMPAHMTERARQRELLVAYAQSLFEAGLLR